ncbi:MAG: hypothetical protein HYZ51_01300 [Candidatus Doudnabacteria bacterium]|nr:hypothetical protein [Candidatus Doudnabacteria bacterium]
MKKKIVGSFMLVALLFSSGASAVFAATTNPISANVSADTASTGWVSLPNLILTESLPAEIPVGALTWALPSGFSLDTTASSTVSYAGAGLGGDSALSFPDNTHFRVNISATSTSVGTLTIGGATPLKVKVSNGGVLASGNITLSSGSVPGIAATTTFGTLTAVVGAPNRLEFTQQPPANITVNQNFSASVGVKDQFGNLILTDSGRGIALGANLASGTVGSLSGVLSKTNVSGVVSFTNLQFNSVGQFRLTAQSTGLAGAESPLVTVSAQATTAPPTILELKNGTLVMIEGQSTVYMVVNGILRPFPSAAVFHARGKKFKDIKKLKGENLRWFLIGKAIGESDDNDDHGDDRDEEHLTPVITPTPTPTPPTSPTPATTTPPVISGLPEGSIVKLPNSPTVYLVVEGQLQPFPSLLTFRLRKKAFADVQMNF